MPKPIFNPLLGGLDFVRTNGMDVVLGTPSDGTLNDGINTWTTQTKVTDALDDCNETLSYLAPADAAPLDGSAITSSGVTFYTGKLSAGNTNYKTGATAGSTVAYITNDGIFKLLSPNTGVAFNKADEGTLQYLLNGTVNDNVYLGATFDTALRAGTQTSVPWMGAGSNLFVTSVGWYNSFPKWQLGNGTVDVVAADLRQGYNAMLLKHTGIATDQTTGTFDVFYDNDAGANPSVTTPTLTERSTVFRYLSGVKYYDRTSTFNLMVAGSNCFNNVYHQTSPLTYNSSNSVFGSGNITETDASVSGLSNPPAIGEVMTVGSKVITVASGNNRDINARLTVTPRDPYTSYTGGSTASSNMLVDAYAQTSNGLNEYFDDEVRRMPAAAYSTVPSPVTNQWPAGSALASGSAQVFNGQLYYPTINFNSGYLPTTQPNYSAFSGSQYYYRAFVEGAATPHSAGTLEVAPIVNLGSLGAGTVNVEIKLPTQTGWLDLGKPYNSGAFTGADGDGCQTATSGSKYAWTAGAFTTANSGDLIMVRVTLRTSGSPLTQLREIGSSWA